MSGGRGNLVEETHDLVQAPIVQSGEVSTFDRSICAFRSELPREPDVAAIAVRLANQCETEGGEPLLYRTDKPINLVMAAALHERVNVSTVFGPESDVAIGDQGSVGSITTEVMLYAVVATTSSASVSGEWRIS